MNCLVLGGSEFIGLHVVRELHRRGHRVAVLNRGSRNHRLPAGVEIILADRKDHVSLRARLAGLAFDALFDIAYAPTTVEDVRAVLEALDGRVGHYLFCSSTRVYDHTAPLPFTEATPRSLYWGEYARHKLEAEDLLLERHRASGVPVTLVRPTHVLGPYNTRDNETFFFDRILRGRPILVPGDGGWLRQFGHVEDLAHAFAEMAGDPRASGQAYNVTGEECVTQAGFVELVAHVMGKPVELVYFDPTLLDGFERPGRVFGQNLVYAAHIFYSTAKARLELGLRPRYTLEAGLRQTYEWYLAKGLDRRPVDFAFEDQLLARLGRGR